MAQLRYGQVLEASPDYQRAVAAQRERDEAKMVAQRLIEAQRKASFVVLVQPDPEEEARKARLARIEEALRKNKKPTPSEIIFAIAAKDGFSFQEIVGDNRYQPLVATRHKAMAAVHRAYPKMPLPTLGDLFNRHRTTVFSALNNIDRPRDWERYAVSPAAIRWAQKMRREGWKQAEIALHLGIPEKRLSRILIAADARRKD
ncbi:helix-turn-helix domain-containing protein [Phyllobacterium sp. 22229]|uniref:helix-turn-helix domain-containing protein n=1 Tax=Phyllobacterium sp. 22229 TaxID=3453895 RepID=UPI003F84675C